jgi:hypothetical protein
MAITVWVNYLVSHNEDREYFIKSTPNILIYKLLADVNGMINRLKRILQSVDATRKNIRKKENSRRSAA